MRRLLSLAGSIFAIALAVPLVALGQPESRVDVIQISGPVDGQLIDFALDTIHAADELGTEVIVLEIDAPAVVADRDRFRQLLAVVSAPPVPMVAWVGPAPATAYGGVLELVAAAPLAMAAPGSEVGWAEPTVAAADFAGDGAVPEELAGSTRTVDGPIPGVIDETVPSIRQLISSLDGRTVDYAGGSRQLTTLTTVEVDSSEEVTTVSTVFHEPGYWARFLRLAVTPEAAFLFLIAGLTVAAFEFYAIGPGIAAGVAAISLFLAGYGIATLPLRWWALGLVMAGWAVLTASYQMGSVALLTAVGTLVTVAGGLWFVDGAPQLQMNPVVTVVIGLVVLFFYALAMPTVARARFSTRTIGRGHLVGAAGVALVDFDPDGEVEVAGARWRASAHREAGIAAGDKVRIAQVSGTILQVEPTGD